MSKNKELVAEAVAAIPLWIAFLDKKEAEQDALLAQMQGQEPETFLQKVKQRLIGQKEEVPYSSAPDMPLADKDKPPQPDRAIAPPFQEEAVQDKSERWGPKLNQQEGEAPKLNQQEGEAPKLNQSESDTRQAKAFGTINQKPEEEPEEEKTEEEQMRDLFN